MSVAKKSSPTSEHIQYVDEVEVDDFPTQSMDQREFPPETHRYMSWSALQFILAPDSKFFFATAILIFVLFFLSVGIGQFIKLDVTTDAEGEIVSDIGLKEAITSADGVVTSVLKKSGEAVQEGDLIALIATDDLSEEESKKTIDSLSTLLKAVENNPMPETVQIESLNLPVAKIHESTVLQSFVTVEQDIRNFLDQKDEINSRVSVELRPLQKKADFLSDNLEKIKQSKQKTFLQHYVDSTSAELEKLQGKIATIQNQAEGKLDEDLAELIRSAKYALGTFESYHAKHEIHAPVTGNIARLDIVANTHVTAGKVVATVIPSSSKYVARMSVKSNDIGKIQVGQSILYKMDVYPYERYGLFMGSVDGFDKIKTSADGQDHSDNFYVRGSLAPPSTLPRELQGQITFGLGMKFSSTIVTERKSLDRVIFERIFKTF